MFGRLYDALTPAEKSDAGRPATRAASHEPESLTLGGDIAFDAINSRNLRNGAESRKSVDTSTLEEMRASRSRGSPAGPVAGAGSPRGTRASEVESRQMPHETYLNLITQVDDLVNRFEHHPDAKTREQALALLEGVDALHREGLTRLVGALREAGAGDLVTRAAEDPVVEILLGLYDLVELDLPDEPGSASSSTFVPLNRVAVSPRAQSDADGAPADD